VSVRVYGKRFVQTQRSEKRKDEERGGEGEWWCSGVPILGRVIVSDLLGFAARSLPLITLCAPI
jgi:hypothetical protein